MKYFGFAIADSMFPANCVARRRFITPEVAREDLAWMQHRMILNPSHRPTIEAAQERFGLDITIPDKAPQVKLEAGDEVMVMSVRGLPRLEGRHEYTEEEIAKAEFTFGIWHVTVE